MKQTKKIKCMEKYANELLGIANQLWKDMDDKTTNKDLVKKKKSREKIKRIVILRTQRLL